MRHSDRSQIGIIDAGDMVIARDPSKSGIITYMEGHETGYGKFGDYGDVIIYSRPGGVPVIHRAIFYAEYNGDGTWNIPSLADYSGTWYMNGALGSPTSAGSLSGTLMFDDFGYNGRTFDIRLDELRPVSGYLTMGDANGLPDQESSISLRTLIEYDNVIAVAAHEVPWLGAIKMYITGNNIGEIPPNTLPSLVITLILMFSFVLAIGILYERRRKR
jgi:signal peptidase